MVRQEYLLLIRLAWCAVLPHLTKVNVLPHEVDIFPVQFGAALHACFHYVESFFFNHASRVTDTVQFFAVNQLTLNSARLRSALYASYKLPRNVTRFQ